MSNSRMNFEESLEYLLSLGHETLAIKLGLKNTELLLERLGNPHESYPSVQVAGTNGKGSTVVILDSICNAAGIKTGRFTSPHLVSITERIVIGGCEISRSDFARLATLVRVAAEELRDEGSLLALPTFFEHVTAIALLAFREAGVSLAILETGLGGRLDATTVAGAEIVAITPVSLDHQQYLGETIEEIAAEKAAIIRPGVIAVVAPQLPAAMDVIVRRCWECEVVPIIVSEPEVVGTTSDGRFRVNLDGRAQDVVIRLRGRHQIMNTAVALQLAIALGQRGFNIEISAVVKGIETANHPGRLQLYDGLPRLLVDGAHNAAGALALKTYLDEFVTQPITLIFGAMKDKQLGEIATVLFPVADRLILTRPNNPRAATVADLGRLARAILPADRIVASRSAADAYAIARELTPEDGLICVSGSLYLLGEILAAP